MHSYTSQSSSRKLRSKHTGPLPVPSIGRNYSNGHRQPDNSTNDSRYAYALRRLRTAFLWNIYYQYRILYCFYQGARKKKFGLSKRKLRYAHIFSKKKIAFPYNIVPSLSATLSLSLYAMRDTSFISATIWPHVTSVIGRQTCAPLFKGAENSLRSVAEFPLRLSSVNLNKRLKLFE